MAFTSTTHPVAAHGAARRRRANADIRIGMAPALSAGEIEGLIRFLGTLDDGYKPD